MPENYIIIHRAPDGSVYDVFWPESSGRLYTEAEAQRYAALDNENDVGGYTSVVAQITEVRP